MSHLALTEGHQKIVREMAFNTLRRFPDNSPVELDDLVQAGMVGALLAIRNHDESKENAPPFLAYMRICIKFEIGSEVRRADKLSPSIRRNVRKVQESRDNLKRPTLESIAADTGLSENSVRGADMAYVASMPISHSQSTDDDDDGQMQLACGLPTPEEFALLNERRERLIALLPRLSKQAQDVIHMKWHDEMQYVEIGKTIGISWSKARLINRQSIAAMSKLCGEDSGYLDLIERRRAA